LPHPFLLLQQTIGNQAVGRIIQAKLTISQPSDLYEQEADRVADEVMRMPDRTPGAPETGGPPQISRLQRKCAQCEEEEVQRQAMEGEMEEEEEGNLQAKEASGEATEVTSAAQAQIEGLRGGGEPLSESVRAFFEPRFGHDFSRVRVHSDARAAASAQSVNALAYTIGKDVVFAAAQFSPATTQGRKLLAHELTHVVQQGQGASSVSGAPRGFVQRKPTSEPEVKVDPGATCNLDQHRKIEPAAYKANEWLSRAIFALDAFLGGEKTKPAQAAAAALNTHFHSIDPAVVTYIRDRLKTIQSDIFTRQNFRVNCPPVSDTECNKAATGQGFAAVVSEDQSELNFCSIFFERSEDDRASTIIHEFGHALLGLSKTAPMMITDRAYKHDPYYAYLTTGEALTNAESYAMFTREVATGSSPAHAFIVDSLRDCPDAWVPIISDALSKARAWNHKAARSTPAGHQFSRAYKILDGKLMSGDSYKCIPDGGGRCSDRVVAYWYAAGDLRICPSLIGLPTADERAVALLAALYAYKGLVDGDDKQQAAAREARRLHAANIPTTADVLTGA